MPNRRAIDLRPGDTFYREGVAVEVLRDSEPHTDRFGQSLFRYWCRRNDTGAEGFCTFGPGGVVSTGGDAPE